MRPLAGEGLRFLASGAVNTMATYAMYLALQFLMPYQAAYAVAFAFGIFLAYRINLAFVFRERHTLAKALVFPLIYLVQYVVGAIALGVLVEVMGVPKEVAPLAVVLVTIPVTFILARLVLRGRSTP